MIYSGPLAKYKKLILSLLLIAVVIAGVFGAGQGVFAVDNRGIL